MIMTPEQVDPNNSSRMETALPENLSETFFKANKKKNNESQKKLKRF